MLMLTSDDYARFNAWLICASLTHIPVLAGATFLECFFTTFSSITASQVEKKSYSYHATFAS